MGPRNSVKRRLASDSNEQVPTKKPKTMSHQKEEVIPLSEQRCKADDKPNISSKEAVSVKRSHQSGSISARPGSASLQYNTEFKENRAQLVLENRKYRPLANRWKNKSDLKRAAREYQKYGVKPPSALGIWRLPEEKKQIKRVIRSPSLSEPSVSESSSESESVEEECSNGESEDDLEYDGDAVSDMSSSSLSSVPSEVSDISP